MAEITPYVLYEDAAAAIDFLTRAFGFTERLRYTDDDGRVSHAELELDGAKVYAAEDPEGQVWYVSQHIRDVAPEEWGARAAAAGR